MFYYNSFMKKQQKITKPEKSDLLLNLQRKNH